MLQAIFLKRNRVFVHGYHHRYDMVDITELFNYDEQDLAFVQKPIDRTEDDRSKYREDQKPLHVVRVN